MINLFREIDIVDNLKTIITNIEENEERKNIIYAYYLATGLKPKECDCKKGIERISCEKCKGAGYILVKDEQIEQVSYKVGGNE